MGDAEKSAPNSAPPKKKVPGRPFQKGGDARSGRGPKKGAPNAGRPTDAVRALALAGVKAATPLMERLARGEHIKASITLPDGTVKDIDIRPNERTSVSAYQALTATSGLNRVTVDDVGDGVQIIVIGGAKLPTP